MLDIIIAILDKLLPEIIKQFIPLVKVQPKHLEFTKSEWQSHFSFFLYNRHKQVLFDVYLLIEIGNAKTEDFQLLKTDSIKDLNLSVGPVEVNPEILQLNCIYEDNKEFILLKISQMYPESFTPFQITANTTCKVKLRILKYSKTQNITLNKPKAAAVSFEIPLKDKGQIRLKGFGILMKRK